MDRVIDINKIKSLHYNVQFIITTSDRQGMVRWTEDSILWLQTFKKFCLEKYSIVNNETFINYSNKMSIILTWLLDRKYPSSCTTHTNISHSLLQPTVRIHNWKLKRNSLLCMSYFFLLCIIIYHFHETICQGGFLSLI